MILGMTEAEYFLAFELIEQKTIEGFADGEIGMVDPCLKAQYVVTNRFDFMKFVNREKVGRRAELILHLRSRTNMQLLDIGVKKVDYR